MFVFKKEGDEEKGVCICLYLYTHKYTHNCVSHAWVTSGRILSNPAALVASGKRGGNYFSLYTFCTF